VTIRVFLVDDHPMYRDGVRVALEGAETLQVIGEADTAETALKALADLNPAPHVVLMDIALGTSSGIEATRALHSGAAGGPAPPRVLIVSVAEDDHSVVAAMRAGASGYLAKGASRDDLIRSIHIVADGGAVFSPEVAGRLRSYFSAVHEVPSRLAFPELTNREREILDLIARGHNNRRIARELVLSEKTVRNHITSVFMKLQVNDRMEATVRARDAGLGF
jgi:DNA-binding NarL/FixJ family response regulator